MKLREAGLAWIDGKQRPFLKWKQITKGRNKGKIEIILGERRVRIFREYITRWPKEG